MDQEATATTATTNPAMEAARRNPRLALMALIREAITTLSGDQDLARGPVCESCGCGPTEALRESIRVGLQSLGVPDVLARGIVAEDLSDGGTLGPFGDLAAATRAAENDQEYGLAYDVRAFHAKFGHAIRRAPEVPTDDEARHRARLVTEEYFEFMAAIYGETANLDHATEVLTTVVQNDPVHVNLPELVDAIEDLKYVLEGTNATCGVDGVPVHRAIQAANMAKSPVLDAEGKPDPLSKPTKPVGWSKPDVRAILAAQGFKE
jgi:predicted HAD superfamily Cof-like phosphohydrolase